MKVIRPKKKTKTRYIIKRMNEILNLTKDQYNGLQELNKWLEDDSALSIALCGSAGTGKTTLMKQFISDNRLFTKALCVAAPTHVAKEKISQITGILNCKTVHELIGMKLNLLIEDFDINKINFITDDTKIQIGKYDIIIIDEGSMINADLFAYLMKFSKMYKTKLLFLGDSYQINPVKEEISPVFKAIKQITLNEIIRQKSTNPISDLIFKAREAVKFKNDALIDFIKENINNTQVNYEGYNIYDDKVLFHKEFISFYGLTQDTYLINYTNQAVEAWNKSFRKELIDSEIEYTTNDKIIGYNTIANSNGFFNIQNSVIYSIQEVQHKITTIMGLELKYFLLTIKNHLDTYSEIAVIKRESVNNFKVIALEMIRSSIQSRSWRNYYSFKENYLLDHKVELQQGQFIDKSLDYSYSITSHKSQGSTYEYAFVNIKNMCRNRNIRERNRLIYVALSRASKGLTILI